MDALIKSFKEHLSRTDCHMAENKDATESLKEAMIKKAKEVRAEIAGVKEALGGVQTVQGRHGNQLKGGGKIQEELKAEVRGLKALVEEVSSKQAAEEDSRRRASPPPVPPLPISAIGERTSSEAPPFPSLPPVCSSLARAHMTQTHSSNVNASSLTTSSILVETPSADVARRFSQQHVLHTVHRKGHDHRAATLSPTFAEAFHGSAHSLADSPHFGTRDVGAEEQQTNAGTADRPMDYQSEEGRNAAGPVSPENHEHEEAGDEPYSTEDVELLLECYMQEVELLDHNISLLDETLDDVLQLMNLHLGE
ncbi:unnamed protein product [Vitrella brassicaformis CCMP3155]|uniref:Uncharacterized protein n=1 Tax=Vitrella brassicaformis (strain CCMP3155) TaxID=1169540 RepID=A0A0G4GRG7_VITBC|nr:unnamed protein product [Vitrella brassicaformis CCMP3155]|eukprot:CEM33137.1 unnamed protein product [Vitrella brassicaformis CCMP3155]